MVTHMIRSNDETLSDTGSAASGSVGLFIDWDNWHFAHFSLVKQVDPRAHLFATLPDIDKALTIASRFGRIIVGAAYGDWTKPDVKRAAYMLCRHHVDLIFVPGSDATTGAPVKNAADIGLAVAMIDAFYRFPHLDTFVLGSGDGGLLPVVTFLRSHGRRVVVLSISSALSRNLADTADAVVRLDDEDSSPAPDVPQAAAPRTSIPFATVIEWMKAIVQQAGGRCSLNALGQQLRDRHQLNAREHYGCSLKELLLRVPTTFAIELEGAIDMVALFAPPSITSSADGSDAAIPAAA